MSAISGERNFGDNIDATQSAYAIAICWARACIIAVASAALWIGASPRANTLAGVCAPRIAPRPRPLDFR